MEDQQLELQALKSIFISEFEGKCSGDEFSPIFDLSSSFSIQVFPSLREVNHVALKLTWKYSPTYPGTALEDIHISPIKGHFSKETIQLLESKLKAKSQELVGSQVVFNLIEFLIEYLNDYNEFITKGDFVGLPKEIALFIFSFLDPITLASLAMTNRHCRLIADDESLWEPICKNYSKYKKYNKTLPENTKPYWKTIFLKIHHLEPIEYHFLGAILARKGTGDEWSFTNDGWKNCFKYELDTKYGIKMKEWSQIKIGQSVSGRFKFSTIASVKANHSNKEWFQALEEGSQYYKSCPYIQNELISFIYFSARKNLASILRAMIRMCRGMIISLGNPDKFIWCIHNTSFGLMELLNRTDFPPHLIRIPNTEGLLKNKYLNDLVEAINFRLSLLLKDKTEKKNVNLNKFSPKKFVDFSNQHKLYPMKLEVDTLPSPGKEKLLSTKIHFWAFNYLDIISLLNSNDANLYRKDLSNCYI